jgi:hypothetical protein
MRRATGSHALLPGDYRTDRSRTRRERAKFFNDFDRAAVLADVVASTSSSLSPARIARVPRVERPAIQSDIGTVTAGFYEALRGIVTALAQTLKWAAPEFDAVAMVRLDVIADGRRLNNAGLRAILA